MSILALIENTGHIYKKKASTHGGEYSGPCPWCGGEDRFSIHPAKDHYVCRRCRKAGDSIQFLITYHNQTYMDACKSLGVTPNIKFKSLDPADPRHQQNIKWRPRELSYPTPVWQAKAEAILFPAFKFLLSATGTPQRKWLNDRGLNNETIKTARLGWNPSPISFDRESWGLDPEKDATGKSKAIWIPAGLIIPLFHDGHPVRLRVRQENPISKDRYIMVSGSYMGYFDYTDHVTTSTASIPANLPVLITEAELDGWLLHQELQDIARVYAIGNASTRPDKVTHENIKRQRIYLNLDNDKAGQAEIPWWVKQYPGSTGFFSDFGKDPGESFQVGDDIRAWGLSGIEQNGPKSSDVNQAVYVSGHDHKKRICEEYEARRLIFETNEKEYEQFEEQLDEKTPEEPEIISTDPVQLIETDGKTHHLNFNSNTCIHGQYCPSYQNGLCLITNTSPWLDLDACPRDPRPQWYKKTVDAITMCILAPGVSKK